MRNISAASLAKLTQAEGSEPINFVEVHWSDVTIVRYADQTLPGLEGKILELSDLENVVDISGNSSNQSINLKLDDTDGSIKAFMNNVDIHKRKVLVYQWFKDIPVSEAFIIFDGEISSPIIWSESERTVSFSVVSKLEDREIGFSAEEGDFEFIPPNLIGKAWPLVFGTSLRTPSVRINNIPTGISANTIGITDSNANKEGYNRLVQNNQAALDKARLLGTEAFILALEAYNTASSFAFDQRVSNDNGYGFDFTSQIDQYNNLGDSYTDKGNDYLATVQEIIHNGIFVYEFVPPEQKSFEAPSVDIANGSQFTQGSTIGLNIGGAYHEGVFSGNTFTIIRRINPYTQVGLNSTGPVEVAERNVAVNYSQEATLQSLWIGQAGSTVVIDQTSNYPIRYIVCLNEATVLNVWAYRNLGGLRQLFIVPPNYYNLLLVDFNGTKAMFVEMLRPLSSYLDEGWEDEIFCDIQSPIGPNVADILAWIVDNYTGHTADPDSFLHVRPLVEHAPANFTITERGNVIQYLQDIAFQSRCAIWYANGRFFLKYLPEDMPAVDEITDDDIESGTLEVGCTDTENIVTKLTATWKPDGATQNNTIIFRQNIDKYGTLPETFDFFIFNQQQSVERAAIFWLIRKCNTWKKMSFSTFLGKLNLEAYDMVTLNVTKDYVANAPVKCMVQDVRYDSANNRLNLVLWVPVRFGEMTAYPFAFPMAVSETIIFPTPQDQTSTGNPDAGAKGQLFNQSQLNGPGGTSEFTRPQHSQGASTAHTPNPGYFPPQPDPPDPPAPSGGGTFVNPNIDPRLRVGPETKRTHKQWQIKDLADLPRPDETAGTWPGFVQGQIEGRNYFVDVYEAGLDNKATRVQASQIILENSHDVIPKDTPCTVVKIVWKENIGSRAKPEFKQHIQFTFYVPIWVPDLAEYS